MIVQHGRDCQPAHLSLIRERGLVYDWMTSNTCISARSYTGTSRFIPQYIIADGINENVEGWSAGKIKV